MSLSNPFEQFEIALIYLFEPNGYDLSLTNLTILTVIVSILIIGLSYICGKSYAFIPNNWQIVMESQYQFVLSILTEQTGSKGVKYFPLLTSLFLLVIFYNLGGLIPFSFTVSSHIIITFTLA
jgi:F-type H+-transporting ATPase subunit a